MATVYMVIEVRLYFFLNTIHNSKATSYFTTIHMHNWKIISFYLFIIFFTSNNLLTLEKNHIFKYKVKF